MPTCRRRLGAFLAFAFLPLLGGCDSLLTEGSGAAAGIGGAAIAHAVTDNGAVVAGAGLGAQAAAQAGVKYLEKRVHKDQQDTIAQLAGPLDIGKVAHWQVSPSIPIEADAQGEVTVSRIISANPRNEPDALDCKEIVFSVDTPQKDQPARAFFTAAVCRDGKAWKWASAEPATERWGPLQ
jgi:hypothetical protein